MITRFALDHLSGIRVIAVLLALSAPIQGLAQVQGFRSGSDGSFGPIVVMQNTTLDVPPDGVIHTTTVRIDAPRVLTFNRNARNTPIYLLATGDVMIGGTIDVSGSTAPTTPPAAGDGGPGGYDGGAPGAVGLPAGAGQGPGGGAPGSDLPAADDNGAGAGSYGSLPFSPSARDGTVYGSPLVFPLLGGSGGGGTSDGDGGGGGGGAIIIASDTRVAFGQGGRVNSNGGGGGGGGNNGSGGAIRIVAPVVVGQGTGGFLDVRGGPGGGAGGVGRTRIDTFGSRDVGVTTLPTSAATVGTFMLVRPSPEPRLDITAAAGQAIPEGSNPVQVSLPTGSSTTQPVTVQARDFTGIVPIEVVVTPENGDRVVRMAQIDMSAGNPSQVTVNVDIPANVTTFIHAWKR